MVGVEAGVRESSFNRFEEAGVFPVRFGAADLLDFCTVSEDALLGVVDRTRLAYEFKVTTVIRGQ